MSSAILNRLNELFLIALLFSKLLVLLSPNSTSMTGPKNQLSLGASFFIVIIAYALAISAGIYVADISGYEGPLVQVAIADVVATIVIFLFSLTLRNSSMYDPYWSVIPIVIAYYWMIYFPEQGNSTRQWIVFGLVAYWGLRLTLNWARSWPGLHHEDWRYEDLSNKTGKAYWLVSFSGIHLFPTVLVFGGMVPVLYIMSSDAPLNFIDYLAAFVTFGAVTIEWISDEQLKSFKRNNTVQGAFVKDGLWAYSRHPNYFGEVAFWVGLFLFAIACSTEYYWTGVGALAMILLFALYSVPAMDERSRENKEGYADYMDRVSAIIPWFPKK